MILSTTKNNNYNLPYGMKKSEDLLIKHTVKLKIMKKNKNLTIESQETTRT